MPSERSAKSAMVVPNVVEATIVAQYRTGWNFFAAICAATSTTSAPRNSAVPARYPQFSVIVTESPPVSPSVVTAILMIQKTSVTSGTLVRPFCGVWARKAVMIELRTATRQHRSCEAGCWDEGTFGLINDPVIERICDELYV